MLVTRTHDLFKKFNTDKTMDKQWRKFHYERRKLQAEWERASLYLWHTFSLLVDCMFARQLYISISATTTVDFFENSHIEFKKPPSEFGALL